MYFYHLMYVQQFLFIITGNNWENLKMFIYVCIVSLSLIQGSLQANWTQTNMTQFYTAFKFHKPEAL